MTRPIDDYDRMIAAEQEVFTRSVVGYMQRDQRGLEAAIETLREFSQQAVDRQAEKIPDGIARQQFRAVFWETWERCADGLRTQIEGVRRLIALADLKVGAAQKGPKS
jgi:hypothetical protein